MGGSEQLGGPGIFDVQMPQLHPGPCLNPILDCPSARGETGSPQGDPVNRWGYRAPGNPNSSSGESVPKGWGEHLEGGAARLCWGHRATERRIDLTVQKVTLGWPWPSHVPWIRSGPGPHRSCQPVALPTADRLPGMGHVPGHNNQLVPMPGGDTNPNLGASRGLPCCHLPWHSPRVGGTSRAQLR